MKKKTLKMGLYSITVSLLAVVLVIGINLFVNSLPTDKTKFDMTPEEIYSLSEQSIKITENIEEDVTIYLLASETEKDTSLYEFLLRYASVNKHIKVVLKDPVLYPNFAKDYTEEDVVSNSVIVASEKRGKYIAYTDIYVTDYSMNYSTYQYDVTSSFDGENNMTSALDYVTSEELPVVYLLTGHGEENISDYSSTIEKTISNENISLTELSLIKEGAVPEDASAVLLFAPQKDISEDELQMLLDYKDKGGKILILTDFISSEQTHLKILLKNYGIEPVEGIVLEADRGYYYQYQTYLLPVFLSHDITNPLKENNAQMLLGNAQAVKEIEEMPDNITVTGLLETSNAAYSKLDGVNITTYTKESGDIDGPFYLAVAAEVTEEDVTSQFVYIPSTVFLADQMNALVSGANHDFFMNCIEWLCEREETISIRAKSLDVETLTVNEESALNWEIILMGVIPVGLLLFGGIVVYRRRK